jgi:hypothetical protein
MADTGIIRDLTERFRRNRAADHAASYDEAELWSELIDPLFASLGWDMRNVAGYALGLGYVALELMPRWSCRHAVAPGRCVGDCAVCRTRARSDDSRQLLPGGGM